MLLYNSQFRKQNFKIRRCVGEQQEKTKCSAWHVISFREQHRKRESKNCLQNIQIIRYYFWGTDEEELVYFVADEIG